MSEEEKKDDGLSYLSNTQKGRWKELQSFLGKEEAIRMVQERATKSSRIGLASALADAIDAVYGDCRNEVISNLVAVLSKASGAG